METAAPYAEWRASVTRANASGVRGQLRRLLTDADLPSGLVQHAVIATSELVGNAFTHAYRPAAPADVIEVEVILSFGAVDIIVRDFGAAAMSNPESDGAGLGLPIAGALADHVGLVSDPAVPVTEVSLRFTSPPPRGALPVGNSGPSRMTGLPVWACGDRRRGTAHIPGDTLTPS
jgi:anti-sigma regulatory factor (Ser/Thr protein kinase)